MSILINLIIAEHFWTEEFVAKNSLKSHKRRKPVSELYVDCILAPLRTCTAFTAELKVLKIIRLHSFWASWKVKTIILQALGHPSASHVRLLEQFGRLDSEFHLSSLTFWLFSFHLGTYYVEVIPVDLFSSLLATAL